MAGCPCQHDKTCGRSCTQAQVQALDQQAPARTVPSVFGTAYLLLFTIEPTMLTNFATNSPGRRFDSNASLCFNGSPPQALLCLWRI
jgi:hypothetical protein